MTSTILNSRFQPVSCRSLRVHQSRRVVTTKAGLFGFGKSKAEVDAEREEQYRLQQELLRKRGTGEMIKEAEVRRKAVAVELKAKKEERRMEREVLARGEIPQTLKDWQPYDEKTEKNSRSGVVIPMVPFGLPKYDAGERFDLRNPFFETGYIDPDEMSPMDSLKRFGKKIFDFSGGKDVEKDARKQVLVPDVDKLGKFGPTKQQKKK